MWRQAPHPLTSGPLRALSNLSDSALFPYRCKNPRKDRAPHKHARYNRYNSSSDSYAALPPADNTVATRAGMARSRGDDPHGFLRQSLSRRWHAPACVASHRMTNLSDSSVQEILPSSLSVVGRDPSLRSTWLSAEQQVGAGSLNANRDLQIKSHYTAQTKQKELNKMATSSKNNPKAFDRAVCFTVFRE